MVRSRRKEAGYPTCAAANLAEATDLVQGQTDVVAGLSLCKAMPERNTTMATKPPTHVVHRSSVDGQFVKPSFAKTHPNTTERQHVRNPAPAPAPTKKK